MSLYNLLFGMNPNADQILALAGLTKEQCGRFRNCYLEKAEGGTPIVVVHTRNGGGNREHYNDEKESGISCDCTGCIATYHLPALSNYLSDEDDDCDCTYADFRFALLPNVEEAAGALMASQGKLTPPAEQWQLLFASMKG